MVFDESAVVGYAIYSLFYTPFASWYSWTIANLANGVYVLGFAMLSTQVRGLCVRAYVCVCVCVCVFGGGGLGEKKGGSSFSRIARSLGLNFMLSRF